MRIVWLPKAKAELLSIRKRHTEVAGQMIAEQLLLIAEQLLRRIVHAAEVLVDHPHLGRPSQSTEGIHELSVPRRAYELPCRIVARRIEILRVPDTRRKPVKTRE